MHTRRVQPIPGQEVVLFGSASALQAYLKLDGVQTLLRRQMVKPLDLADTLAGPGTPGTAYVRDRTAAKHSPGALRRSAERAARRGIQVQDKPSKQPATKGSPPPLALYFGSAVVHVRAIEAVIGTLPLLVGTYGFSAPGAPAVLPIERDRLRHRLDDAA